MAIQFYGKARKKPPKARKRVPSRSKPTVAEVRTMNNIRRLKTWETKLQGLHLIDGEDRELRDAIRRRLRFLEILTNREKEKQQKHRAKLKEERDKRLEDTMARRKANLHKRIAAIKRARIREAERVKAKKLAETNRAAQAEKEKEV